MGLSQGEKKIRLKFNEYKHLNSMQIVSIHNFSTSTVLLCTADSRDPYSSTSSWVLVKLRLLSLIQLFWVFWILDACLAVGHSTIGKGCHVQSTLCFWRHFGGKPCSVKVYWEGFDLGKCQEAAHLDVG